MDTEFGYMAALARALSSVEERSDAPRDLDWNRFAVCLRRHHLTATLGPLIDRSAAPSSVLAAIDREVRRLRIRQAWISAELDRIMPVLEGLGFRATVLKGAALAHTVYAGRGARFFSDVDILVDLSDVEAVCRTLEDLQYQIANVARPTAYYDRYHFHRILKHPSGLPLEVHWALTRPGDWIHLDARGLLDRSRLSASGGTVLRVPSNDDQILHTVIQCLQDGFGDFRRFVDLAFLLVAANDAERRFPSRAEASGLSTALWLALSCVERTLDVPIPAALERRLEPPPHVRHVLQRMVGPVPPIDSRRPHEIRALVRWLCAPSISIAFADAIQYVMAPRAELEEGAAVGDGILPVLRRGFARWRRATASASLAGIELVRLVKSEIASVCGTGDASTRHS